jgi:hypothetical protein
VNGACSHGAIVNEPGGRHNRKGFAYGPGRPAPSPAEWWPVGPRSNRAPSVRLLGSTSRRSWA